MNKKASRIALIFLCALCIVMASVSVVFAKYIRSYSKNTQLQSPEFYFESDYLSEITAVYYLNPGTNSVDFSLKNHIDELRYSTNVINYTVELTTDKTDAVLSSTAGQITNNAKESAVITLSGMVDGGIYTVTATGSAGFTRTLSATFIVKSTEPKLYKYVDLSTATLGYIQLTVWTENLAGDVKITLPLGLLPDNTREGMEDLLITDRSFTQSFEKYSSKIYRFIITADFSSANFEITCGTVVAENSTPANT